MSQGSKLMAQLGVLVLVAAGLGGYAYFGVFKKDQVATEKKNLDEKLFTTAKVGDKPVIDGGALKTEFTKLTVTAKGQTTQLERSIGGTWQIVGPVRADVDSLVIDALTSQLQQAKFKTTLDENPTAEDLVKYGLQPPEFVVEATAVAGGETHSVKLEGGIENTFDGSIYMRRNGEKTVYLAEGGVRWALSKSTFDLRRKEVLGVDEAPLKTIEVTAKNNAYRLERNDDKTWQIVRPTNALADSNVISGLIGLMKTEKAVAFPPETNAGALTTTAIFTMNDGKTVKLELGRFAGDAGVNGFVRRTDENGTTFAEVGPSTVTNLDRNPLDFRDKTIVTFKKELVTRVVVHNANGTEFSVDQAPSEAGIPVWKIGTTPAKTFKVTGLIWLLGTIRGSAFSEEKVSFEKARFFALFGADGKELAKFSIGPEVPGKPNVFFVRGTRPQVIEVDGSRFNELPTTAAELIESADGGK